MQLGQPHHVEAQRLGRIDLRERLGKAVGVGAPRKRGKLVKHAEFHGDKLLCRQHAGGAARSRRCVIVDVAKGARKRPAAVRGRRHQVEPDILFRKVMDRAMAGFLDPQGRRAVGDRGAGEDDLEAPMIRHQVDAVLGAAGKARGGVGHC